MAGFKEIEGINFEVEVDQIAEKQDELKEEIKDILDEADEEIAEVVEDGTDLDEAQDEIDDIMDDAGKLIEDLNIEHDIDMMSTAQTSLITTLTNKAAEEAVIDDIIEGLEEGEKLEEIVEEQVLPFKVDVIPIEEKVRPKATLRRKVCVNGVCKTSLKEDP